MELRKQIPIRVEEDDHRTVWLDPDAQVILTLSLSANGRPFDEARFLPDDSPAEDLFIVEPFRPNFRRQFRPTMRWQFRWQPDVMVSTYEYVGKPDSRCRQCLRYQRSTRLRYDREVGCPNHVRWQKVDQRDPKAGKVFARVSSVKVYGVAPETTVLFQEGDRWVSGKIQPYPMWREQERAEERAANKVKNRRRRHARLPSRWERMLNDPWGLDGSGAEEPPETAL